MEYAIEVNKLSKSFGDVKAVDDLSFRVKSGEFFAFLGVNGAGKSTTISIMCSQLRKDSGNVFICGKNTDQKDYEYMSKLGIVFQNSVLDKALTVKENLYSRAALYGINGRRAKNRVDELSEILDFKDLLNRKVGKLSGGQRRRVDIARAILHRPEILILDEPTTGLDPQTRKLLWNVISDLRKNENMTVFLTTHYMEEASEADYVVIIDSGKIAAEGTPIELKNKYTGDYIILYGAKEDDVKHLGMKYDVIHSAVCLAVNNTREATKLILQNPDLFEDYEIIKGKMDDVFIAVTGKKIDEEK